MSEDAVQQRVSRLMRILAERIESYLEGDELAFETLGETLEEEGFVADDLQAAAWMLRGLIESGATAPSPGADPGEGTLRVLSAEERETLSPAAWGYLLDLKRRGSLDAAQVERVLGLCAESAVRPVDTELAREFATRVALLDDQAATGDIREDDGESIH